MRRLLALLAASFSILCIGTACTSKGKPPMSMTPQETVGELQNRFAILIDVREKDEVASGMASLAQWEPLSKIEADDAAWKTFTASLPKDKRIILYCRSGKRAGKVADRLAAEGFSTGNMGGFDGWVAAGLPTKKP